MSTRYKNSETLPNLKDSMLEKYGFDIKYDPKADAFVLVFQNAPAVLLEKENTDFKTYEKNYKKELKEIFSKPTEFIENEVDFSQVLQNPYPLAQYNPDNSIVTNRFFVNDEDRDKCLAEIIKKGHSKEDAEKRIESIINQSQLMIKSVRMHELSHMEDHRDFDNDKNDLPLKYIAKLNFMTEIKATMTQAGLAFEEYQKNGDLSGFDCLCCETQQIKEKLPNYDLKNQNQIKEAQTFIAQTVYKNWLIKNNVAGSTYSRQAEKAVECCPNPVAWSFADDRASDKEYRRRVDKMFQNVYGLGDVHQCVDPEIELNDQLKGSVYAGPVYAKRNNNAALKAIMQKDAQNSKQYSRNIQQYMRKVKRVDRDGIRTDKEVQKLSKYVDQSIMRVKKESER